MSLNKVLSGLKILVVDDLADQREVLSVVLERLGAEVVTAASADEALDALAAARPDVLLSDLNMPGRDGYSLIESVRKLRPERGGSVPAAALTGYSDSRDHALGAGFQAYATKPVADAELAAIVASLARRSGAEDHGWTRETRVLAAAREFGQVSNKMTPLTDVLVVGGPIPLDLGRESWLVRVQTASRSLVVQAVLGSDGYIETVRGTIHGDALS